MTDARQTLDAALAAYVAALNALDEQRFFACFRSNCVVRDPYGTSIYEGPDGLQEYFKTIHATWQSLTLTPEQVYYGGAERIVWSWTATGTAANGKTATFTGIMVMTLEGDLIDGLESYWDAAAVVEQITA